VPVQEENGQLKAGMPEQFLKNQFSDSEPMFSPDGKWLAYSSAGSEATREVYVRPFPPPASGQGGRWGISTQGGQNPVWSRTSHDLLYLAPGGQIMAVSYTVKGETFVADQPRVWIASLGGGTIAFDQLGSGRYDLSPDGRRLAVVTSAEASPDKSNAEHEVVFLQNFLDELRRRVPTGK
jgi:Tol biopolymer transport system component